MSAIIQVQDVHKSFRKVKALAGVSLQVERGTIFGLLGPNGAGKTTLIRILTTLLKPDSGTATVAGLNVAERPAHVRSRIGLAGQYAAVDENLTGQENLELVGRLYHLSWCETKTRAQHLLNRFSLTDAAHRRVKTYSGGMRRRLDLAASLVGEPEILFLDEPTTGLDPRSRLELWNILEALVKEGTTLMLTTQYLEEADYLANTVAVIDQGKVIAQGTPGELKTQVGGGVLELHLSAKEKTTQALLILTQLKHQTNLHIGEPQADPTTGSITVPTHNGTQTLIETVRAFDAAKLELADIELRKPSLDEVFLTLTGKPHEPRT